MRMANGIGGSGGGGNGDGHDGDGKWSCYRFTSCSMMFHGVLMHETRGPEDTSPGCFTDLVSH